MPHPPVFAYFTFFFFISSFGFLSAIKTMTPGQSLRDRPLTETPTVVWVANRDRPLTENNGVFTFQNDGNLAVLDGSRTTLWNTSISTNATGLVAVLLDSGILVLSDGPRIVWQSFDYPFDTLLPGMIVGGNPRTRSNCFLISPKKEDNLSMGILFLGVDPDQQNQLLIGYNWTTPNWQRGVWNGIFFEEIPEVTKNFLFHFTKNSSEDKVSFMYSTPFMYTRLVLDSSGELQLWIWFESDGQWRLGWWTARDGCDSSSECVPNSVCNSKNSPMCGCLPGFEPASSVNWNMGDWRDGFHRKEVLQCGRGDEFWPLSVVYISYILTETEREGFITEKGLETEREHELPLQS